MPSPPEPSSARLLKAAKEGQSSKTPGGRKRTGNARISAACEACKKRKTKCSGGPPPCQLCKTLGTECVIDLSLDMRRRAAFRRTVDESKSFQDALNALIDGIREGPSTRLEVLFEHIKSGATNQEVTMAIQQYLMPSEDDDGDESMLLQPDSGGSIETEDFKISTGLSETSSPDQALSDTSRGKAAELAAMPLSTLLSSLKSQPEAQGESLLRQFLASKHSEKVILPAWSPAGKSPWKGAGPGINPPSISERITWHPALHVGEDPQQVGPSFPFRVEKVQRAFVSLFNTRGNNVFVHLVYREPKKNKTPLTVGSPRGKNLTRHRLRKRDLTRVRQIQRCWIRRTMLKRLLLRVRLSRGKSQAPWSFRQQSLISSRSAIFPLREMNGICVWRKKIKSSGSGYPDILFCH